MSSKKTSNPPKLAGNVNMLMKDEKSQACGKLHNILTK